jgi:p-aminobenzoyl-glutamate transporter AbgT
LKKYLTYAFIGLVLVVGLGVYVADAGGAHMASDPRGGIIILDK